MPFKDLGDWSDIASLELPFMGTNSAGKKLTKSYTIPPVDAELGPRIQAIMDQATTALHAQMVAKARGETAPAVPEPTGMVELLSDDEERKLYPRLLGPAYEEMLTDLVPWSFVQHCAATTMIDASIGRQAAEMFWEQRAPGKSEEEPVTVPNRAQRRATGQRTRTGSTAGTTTRKRPAAQAAAAKSTGRRSSSSGG